MGVFVDNILPIFVIAGLGFLIGKRLEIDSQQLGRLLFNVLSPALVFHSLTTTTISPLEFGQLFFVMTVFVSGMALLALVTARFQSESKIERAGFVLSAMWPNDGNLGLPLISFAFGPDVLARGVIFYVAVSILNYTLGLFVASRGQSSGRQAMMKIAKVPMIYAVIAGLVINLTHIVLPLPFDRSITLLSQATIPLMLVMLGVQLGQAQRLKQPRLIFWVVGLRLVASPFVALVLGVISGLNPLALVAFIMQASMPVAVATIIFASEFQLDSDQVVGSVLVSTLVSPITLSVLILLLQKVSMSGRI